MFSFIFLILGIKVSSTQGWNPTILLGQNDQFIMNGLQGFSVDEVSFYSQKKILVFGGQINGVPQNRMVSIDIESQEGTVSDENAVSPSARYNHCSVVDRYKLFLYGGVDENGSILTDLWEYNTLFLSWTKISENGPEVQDCCVVLSQDFLILSGKNPSNTLYLSKFSINSRQWLAIPYSYRYAIQQQGKLWDNTSSLVTTYFNIGQNFTDSTLEIKEIPIDYSCILLDEEHNYLIIITREDIYTMDLGTYEVLHVRKMQKAAGRFQCGTTDEWVFVVDSEGEQQGRKEVMFWHYHLEDLNRHGYFARDEPEASGGLPYLEVIVIGGRDLWIIANSSAWILPKLCQTPSVNIETCFYGQVFCTSGFTGNSCQIPKCPNSLTLFDAETFSEIKFECSNHGTCTQEGCICDEHWGGADCSMYERKSCEGNLVQNWPVMNCECEEESSGGNNCEVTFCYNDCSQHGECLSNGQCSCFSGYYGADCSIIIIEFPGASYSI